MVARRPSIERNDTVLGVIRRALEEFLALPVAMVIAFLVAGLITYALDHARVASLEPMREALQMRMFGSAKTTSELLGTIASGIITVTSITISVLLLAVQQAASALTHQVFDQFLRRRSNQLFFGYFIGLAVYTLLTLATVAEPFNPVFGATLALLLTVVALVLLLMLLYSTIDQMRPEEIIDSIHGLTLRARERQLPLLQRTRRVPSAAQSPTTPVLADSHGYVTMLDVDHLERVAADRPGIAIAVAAPIGTFVATGDIVAVIGGVSSVAAAALDEDVRRSIRLERQRDITTDAAFGLAQLGMIAWTSISTAKSNPVPGLVSIRSLRDILARWSDDKVESDRTSPVVYPDDVIERLMNTFESLAVAASESMQHQSLAEMLRALVVVFDRLPSEQQLRVEDLVLRSLSALGDHVLTRELDVALRELIAKLRSAERTATADAAEAAWGLLNQSVGRLNSRATRVGRATG